MRRYLYNYQTVVTFSEPVSNHAVLLRCQPWAGGHQTIEEEHLVVPPAFRLRRATDGFGNRIVYGGQRDPHGALAYVSCGIACVGDYALRDAPERAFLFRLPSRQATLPTGYGELLTPSHEADTDALAACHKVHALLEYTPGVTSIATTAEEALSLGKGVCQDYAHVMIALCRCHRVPARYACGFIEGEGQTHAWVEAFDGYAWHAHDPTHDRTVQDGYVKLAHGRDAADCPVSRGVYRGNAMEQTQITVTLKEI